MKKRTFFISTGIALLLGTAASRAQLVDFNQLPGSVQETINQQRGPAGIVSIRRMNRYAIPVYDVQLDHGGANSEFYVTETGTLIKPGSNLNATLPLRTSQEIAFSALPMAVQNTIRSQLGNAPIDTIESITANGRTAYEVPYRVNDRLADMWVDPAGNVIAVSPSRTLLSNPTQIGFTDLPQPVQDALRVVSAGATVDNVLEGTLNGQTVYETTVDRGGRPIDLRFTPDGLLIRDAVDDRFLAETGRLPGSTALVSTATPVARRVPLIDPAPVSFNQLPPPVLQTLQTYAGPDLVRKIDRGIAQGQTVYQAVFQHAGQDIPLRIMENGALVNDDVNNWFLTTLSPVRPVVASQDWRSSPARAPLSSVTSLRWEQLPLAVQDTLRYYAAGSPIRSLDRGMVNDQTVYEANLKWRDQETQLRIAEDGSLINDQPNDLFLAEFPQSPSVPVSVGSAPTWQRGTQSSPP